jgi:hypothetical protein
MAFHHKYNTDDVIIRACIVGLVNELNNKINFYNTWGDDDKRLVRVPFFYSMAGDERFLQDAFDNWNDCYPDFIEGNTDPIPRGTLTLQGTSIMSNNLTSRYVRGYYTKEVQGELKRYNSYINSIPIQLNFNAEIMCDTDIESFKIAQSCISVLYRTLVFSVNYDGFRVPTQAGFPESYDSDKQFEFTYGTTERLKVSFDVELQSYLPIPDQAQEMFGGNKMSGGIRTSFDIDAGDFNSNNPNNEENVLLPPDTPNLAINETFYRNTNAVNDPETDPGQANPGANGGEGFNRRATYYSSQYWR